MNRSKQILKFTRRQFLGTLPFMLLIPGKKVFSLENDALSFRLTLARDAISSRTFENRLTGKSVTLPTEEFLLKFDNGRTVSSLDMELKPGTINKKEFEMLFTGKSGLKVKVTYSLSPEWYYLRKQIAVRNTGKPSGRLLIVNLENWQGVKFGWDSMHADAIPFGSHPVFCDDLWAGVEFVAAFNEYSPNGFILRSKPGGVTVGNEWVDLHSTVTGVSETGKVRDSFLNYIEDIRLAPPRIVACYNSWWTLPKVVTQRDNLSLINELRDGMYGKHGTFFDIITTDMGWSNPRSIWEIDRSILPRGFDDIREIVEPAGGRLGLWMSPSELYPPVCDYDWAEKNGYVVSRPDGDKLVTIPALSLADPKYRNETCVQLKELITINNLGHIKYDGFKAIEHSSHNGLLPGEDSVEPLAEYSLELLKVSKDADPNLVTEPTYMNSFYNYISPWIIKYSDSVWGNAVDCVVGIGPAPDYRESHTNAREYIIFKSLDQVWLPQNALQYFDITHVDESEGFPNHAAMAFGRGRFFISTYLNPKLMNDDDWRIYSGFLRWARGNTDILRNTNILKSRVEAGEPYAYAHWLGRRGIIAVRNPSNESCQFELDLAKTSAPHELAEAICYTQYPCRRGIADGLKGDSRLKLVMAPWEILFLEIVQYSELKEAVAIGARWYRSSDGKMSIVPDHGAESVRLFEPGKEQQVISVPPGENDDAGGKLISLNTRQAPENQWLTSKPRSTALFPFRYPMELTDETIRELKETHWKDIKWKNVPATEFEIECTVSVPIKSSGKVLLLVEFPGRNPCPSRCEGTIDDSPAELKERNSTEHIGYFVPDGSLRSSESEWCWYICRVSAGSHRINFKGFAGHPAPKFGLWVWTDRDLTDFKQLLSVHCSEPAMPQYNDAIERTGICLTIH